MVFRQFSLGIGYTPGYETVLVLICFLPGGGDSCDKGLELHVFSSRLRVEIVDFGTVKFG